MTPVAFTRDEILAILEGVPDPEVPVLSIVDLGIVRDVELAADGVTIVITPTYSGCPAMRVIEDDIVRALGDHGIEHARIRTVYSPPWTTDWLSADAKRRLEEYGIAPPGRVESQAELVPLRRRASEVRCPFCRSTRTRERSEFGSTACKSLWYCEECRQPFEAFKAI